MRQSVARKISLFALLWLWCCGSGIAQAQTGVAELAPNANLEVMGIPPVPAALAQQVKQYSGAYGLPLAGWDPEKRVILLKGLSSVGWVSRVGAPQAAPQTWLYVQENNLYDFYFQPQGKYVLYNRDLNGNEAFQLYCYDIGKRTSVLLSDGKSRSTEPVWSTQGKQIVYSSSLPGQSGVNLNLVNPADPKSNRMLVAARGNYLKAYDWSPDDAFVVYCEFVSNTQSRLWSVEVASGKTKLLSPKNEVAYYGSPQFSRDGKGMYVITDRASDMRQLAYLNLATQQFTYLTFAINWDVEEFRLSPDGKSIGLVINEAGLSRLYVYDIANRQMKKLSALAGIITDLHWHNNAIDLAFNFKASNTPNDVYSVDVTDGKVTQWAQSVNASPALAKLSAPEAIAWKSFDGKMITGFLARPPATFSGKRPVVIDLHGGPTEQYRPVYNYEESFLLNELGVAVIHPNVRGSSGFGKTFLALDNGVKRLDAVKDIAALLDWIQTQSDLDTDRILVKGASYGGYLALSIAATHSNRLRGAISDAGMTNLVSFLTNTEGWRREIQRAEFGDEGSPKLRAYLEKISPLQNAQQINCPVFVVQGKNDPRVPVSEASSLVQALKQKKLPVWYLLAKNEGHGFGDATNRAFQLYSTILFVKEYLLH